MLNYKHSTITQYPVALPMYLLLTDEKMEHLAILVLPNMAVTFTKENDEYRNREKH